VHYFHSTRFSVAGPQGRLVVGCWLLVTAASQAATFRFQTTDNGLDRRAAGAMVADQITMNLTAGPASAGALMREFNSGLGIVMLTGLDFDGVKDESLEFFTLETFGVRLHFFDSQAIRSLVESANLPGEVVYLDEISSQIDDEVSNLKVRFAAGQLLTLTYGELDGQVVTLQRGNGARLQAITVQLNPVPEPAAVLPSASLVIGWIAHRRVCSR